MRQRDDNALEVWLNDGKEILPIGWLTGFGGTTTRIRVNERTFILDTRDYEIKDVELYNLRGTVGELVDMIATKVPGYAEEWKLPMCGGVKFVWRVLTLSLDDYEWIFDLDTFDPEDTEVDSGIFERPTFSGDPYTDLTAIPMVPSTATPFKSIYIADTSMMDWIKAEPDYAKMVEEEIKKKHHEMMMARRRRADDGLPK